MKIAQLVADLNMIEARLIRSLETGADAAPPVRMLRRSADLMDTLERIDPADAEDRRAQIDFFVQRAARNASTLDDGRDAEIALRLMSLYGPRAAAPAQGESNVHTHSDLAAYISHSRERVVAMDLRYRYLATSEPNAAFHGTTPIRMAMRNMLDIVGPTRFFQRAKRHADRAFSGRTQEYYYPLDTEPGGQRIIRCEMKPVRDGIGQVWCVLVYMKDMSDPNALA